ncbi:RNA polymerase sigma factor [Catenulispora yoronensis]|uniref:RNA polymerase sigma factor n=1 Tax=Catenulispora yoronensis TaxID=450799 RepID=A0ABN2V3N0_9ACTN
MLDGQELADALVGAVRGDEDGFAVLWRALNPPLLRYLRVLIPDAGEDVASETWLQAARDLGGFTGDVRHFQVWLFRIARNRAIDEGRRARRKLDEPVAVLPDRGSADDTAEAALTALATRRALAVIAELPRDQAEAVLLRAVAGLSADQAGAVVGKRAGAVRVAAMRGLRTLKKKLDKAATSEPAEKPQAAERAAHSERAERAERTEREKPPEPQATARTRTGSRAGVTR